MKYSPKRNHPKGYPRQDSGRGKKKSGIHQPKEDSEGKVHISAEGDPEKIAAAYDRAIKEYEAYYQQAAAMPGGGYPCDPYSLYYPVGYKARSYAEQGGGESGQAFAEYERGLQSLEQALSGFQASVECMKALEGKERDNFIKEWKEYLQAHLEFSKQLSGSIEASIQAMSSKTS